jgi:hypothetical protein
MELSETVRCPVVAPRAGDDGVLPRSTTAHGGGGGCVLAFPFYHLLRAPSTSSDIRSSLPAQPAIPQVASSSGPPHLLLPLFRPSSTPAAPSLSALLHTCCSPSVGPPPLLLTHLHAHQLVRLAPHQHADVALERVRPQHDARRVHLRRHRVRGRGERGAEVHGLLGHAAHLERAVVVGQLVVLWTPTPPSAHHQ